MQFSEEIVAWYNKNKRELPWRNINDAYRIWLSEIILQQTRVEQGLPYYIKFVKTFPTVKHLANAKQEEVLKLWQGLGYYSRARNLHEAAKEVVQNHKGKFPTTFDEIIKLKGIGDYTAAAISSFAFNEAKPVVDGNVYRLLSRYFGIDAPIDSTLGKKQFYELALELLNKKYPATHNQAIMEFGAIQCKPQNPDCLNCPLNSTCVAFSKKLVGLLPVKAKKTAVKNRYFNYLVISDSKNVLLNKRTGNDIWQGLHDFPLIESDKRPTDKKIMAAPLFNELLEGGNYKIVSVSEEFKHVLSHRIIYARFWKIEVKKLKKTKPFLSIPLKTLDKYSIPRLVDIYLKKNT